MARRKTKAEKKHTQAKRQKIDTASGYQLNEALLKAKPGKTKTKICPNQPAAHELYLYDPRLILADLRQTVGYSILILVGLLALYFWGV